jgi:hypothetical protein
MNHRLIGCQNAHAHAPHLQYCRAPHLRHLPGWPCLLAHQRGVADGKGRGHMRNSAGHSDTTQAVCSVFVRMRQAPFMKAVASCSSACMSVHACGDTHASLGALPAPSSHCMQLPVPHLSDIAATMQHAPIYVRCMHSARQACIKLVACGWWDAACTHTHR